MFSPVFGRALRSTGCLSSSPAGSFGRATALGAAQQSFSRPSHQRRPSSSKPSIPPDGSKRHESSSTALRESHEQKQTSSGAGKRPAKRAGKAGKKQSTSTPTLNVPHVPPTHHLHEPDVKVSSFWSLHRPISVGSFYTLAVPPASTNAAFESIFKSRTPNDRSAMMENIESLSSGIENLEATLRVHEREAPEETLQVEADVKHLDSLPNESISQLMRRGFVPFQPPAAPTSRDPARVSETPSSQKEGDLSTAPAAPKQRAWSTEVIVTESRDASGQRTYSATTSPMVEIALPGTENSQDVGDVQTQQPFLERMRQRQNTSSRRRAQRPGLQAISVKRQRKLKMKKHKYKKLMKRTRLLRRKLDRT